MDWVSPSVKRYWGIEMIDVSVLKKGGIVSDGGSSDYYKLPNSLVEKALATSELQTEDIIEHVFDNDFDFGNIFKTIVRLHGLSKGKGKAGNTASYECNKILYSVKKIDKRLSNATPTWNGDKA